MRGGTLALRHLYHLKIEGIENIPSEGACIILCTKQGALPGTWIVEFLRTRRPLESVGVFAIHWVFAKRSFLRPRPLPRTAYWYPRNETGRLYLWGFKFPGRSASELLRALELLSQGVAIGLYAEGEMSWDGRLQRLQPGAAWLALKAHAPIVPVVTIGGYDTFPRWMARPRLRGRITIRVGSPFHVSDRSYARVTSPMIEEANRQIRSVLDDVLAKGL